MSLLSGMDIAMAGGPPTLKKTPILSSTASQQKKVTAPLKTYVFELELGESNDQTYPEFSWADLVKDAKDKELTERRKQQGGSLLDPYASDDEEHLKDLAARLEEKYGQSSSTKPSKKKKQKMDDFIDRAAGYDESDSFIDNTDAYDEKIPRELQPACGGFYINSGQLDFREVQVSEDDDEDDDSDSDSDSEKTKTAKSKSLKSSNTAQKDKSKLKTTKVVLNSTPLPKVGEGINKKRKLSQDTPVSRPKPSGQSQKPKPNNLIKPVVNANEVSNKKRARQISSSSNSSSEESTTSSSEESSTSTGSNAEEAEGKPKAAKSNNRGTSSSSPEIVILNSKAPPFSKTLQNQKQKNRPPGSLLNATNPSIKPTTLTPRKPRVKNVPLNPKLKRTDVPGALPLNNTTTPIPPATITRKILNPKDFIKSKSESGRPKLANNSNAPSNSPSSFSSQQNTPASSLSPSTIVGNKTSTPTSVIKVPTPKSSSFSSTPTNQTGTVTTTPTSQMQQKSSSHLSLSSELVQIFPDAPSRQSSSNKFNTSGSSGSPNPTNNVTYNKTAQPPQPKTKPAPITSATAESMAKDLLKTIANASGVGSQLKTDKNFPAIRKPLPKLKHKSGLTIEKQKTSPSPPSSFNAKPKKVNPKHIVVNPLNSSVSSPSQRVLSPQNATITATSHSPSSSSVFQSPSSPFNTGTVEITKLKKKAAPLPGLGAGITVTEVRDKAGNSSNISGNSMFTGSNKSTAKGSSFNQGQGQQSPVTITPHQSSNFISSTTSSLTGSNQKIAHSVTISPSPLQNLTSDLSDRFNIGNFLVNKQNNKLPGYITSYDVNALLSGSNPLPDIPGSKSNSDSQRSSNNSNRN